MPRGRVTLADVAEASGVSLATASRVLNGSTRTVRPELRDRVLAAGDQLGYRPNLSAQAMARGASDLVGLVLSDLADPWDAEVAAGVLDAADEQGLVVCAAGTGRSPAREAALVAALGDRRAGALVLMASRTSSREASRRLAAEVDAFRSAGGRVAVLGQRSPGIDTVVIENRAAARALGRALAEQGWETVHVLAGPKDLVTARDRLAGLRDAAGPAGLGMVVHGEATRDGGHAAALDLADSTDLRGSCVVAVGDALAVGALAALRERRLRVPQDVGVAGFDDLSVAREVTPALTSVALPLRDLGRRVAALALSPPPDGDAARVERVTGEVVLRASTRRRSRQAAGRA